MSQREVWIERDRLDVELLRFVQIFQQGVGAARNLGRPQIKNVSFRILRRFRFHPRFLVRTECDTERLGNFGCQFALQA
jgi:hypothetical protein